MTAHKKVSKPARLNVVRAGKGAETYHAMVPITIGIGGTLMKLWHYCAARLRITMISDCFAKRVKIAPQHVSTSKLS